MSRVVTYSDLRRIIRYVVRELNRRKQHRKIREVLTQVRKELLR